jgi:putative transposase
LLDESGFLLAPTVRRTWAPCAQTPLLFHRYSHDRISAISAVTVSPQRERLGLYCHCHFDYLSHREVAVFLRLLLPHLRGHIMLLWDGGSIHRGPARAELFAPHPRLHVERLPAYAPELNPDEQVWNHCKAELANGCPLTVDDLLDDLTRVARRTRCSSRLLRSFIHESDLPPFLSS